MYAAWSHKASREGFAIDLGGDRSDVPTPGPRRRTTTSLRMKVAINSGGEGMSHSHVVPAPDWFVAPSSSQLWHANFVSLLIFAELHDFFSYDIVRRVLFSACASYTTPCGFLEEYGVGRRLGLDVLECGLSEGPVVRVICVGNSGYLRDGIIRQVDYVRD